MNDWNGWYDPLALDATGDGNDFSPLLFYIACYIVAFGILHIADLRFKNNWATAQKAAYAVWVAPFVAGVYFLLAM